MQHTTSINTAGSESVAKRIVMIDDHASYTEGLAQAFNVVDDLNVVGRETSAADGVNVALEVQPDLVLCDYRMPGQSNGIECAERLRTNGFTGEIVILTGFAAPHVHADAELLDNVRVISKDLPLGELIQNVSAADISAAARAAEATSDEYILNEIEIAESANADSNPNRKRKIFVATAAAAAALTAGIVLLSGPGQAPTPTGVGLERPFVVVDGSTSAVRVTVEVDGTPTQSFVPANLPVTVAVDAGTPSTNVQVVVENLDAAGSANCSIGVNKQVLVSDTAQAQTTAVCATTIN